MILASGYQYGIAEGHTGSRMNLLGPNVDPVLEHGTPINFAFTKFTPRISICYTNDPTVPVKIARLYRSLEHVHIRLNLHIYAMQTTAVDSAARSSLWQLAQLLRNWLLKNVWLRRMSAAACD